MNALTVLLTSLMGLFSITGMVPDRVIEKSIRDQIDQVETLAVRTDLDTNHQLLQGEIQRLRIAARGIYPLAEMRIDTLDVETDGIDIDVAKLLAGDLVWDQPFQAAVNMVVIQEDIDQALRSPSVVKQLETINTNLLDGLVGGISNATLTEPVIQLLGNDRISLSGTLTENQTNERLVIEFSTGLAIADGTQLRFIEPELTANDVAVPSTLVSEFINGFTQAYTLKILENQGITARLLNLEITDESISVASFVRLESVESND
ncbi:MAG: DUF2993 domain-containing protein [Cyanobacteria bacterium P01_F01_bin.150]